MFLYICNLPYFLHVMIQHALTVVYFLAEHDQQHVVVRREQLMDSGSLKQGAENFQKLHWVWHQTGTSRKSWMFISRDQLCKTATKSTIFISSYFQRGVTYLKGGMEVFGVLEGQIEDGSQPLIKIFALLHKTIVVPDKILDPRWDCMETLRTFTSPSLSLPICRLATTNIINFIHFSIILFFTWPALKKLS